MEKIFNQARAQTYKKDYSETGSSVKKLFMGPEFPEAAYYFLFNEIKKSYLSSLQIYWISIYNTI